MLTVGYKAEELKHDCESLLLLRRTFILNAAQTWTAVGGFFRSVVVTVSWLCPMVCSTQSPLPPGRVEVGVEVEYPLPVGPVLVNSWSPKPLELKLSNYLVFEHPLPPLNSASTMLKRWRIRQTLIDQGLPFAQFRSCMNAKEAGKRVWLFFVKNCGRTFETHLVCACKKRRPLSSIN